jgi:Undecaprenyl-phosphate galactose phosphotransferase WbaP
VAVDVLLDAQRSRGRRQRRVYLSEALIGLQLCLIDALLILAVLAGYFAAPAGRAAEGTSSGWAVLVGFAAFPLAKLAAGLYPGHGLARAQRFRGSLLAVGVGIVLLAAISRVPELLADTPPRGLVAPALLTTALLLAGDPIARRALLRLGRWCQPVFIFGGGDTAGEVVRQLKLYPELGYQPACIVDDGSIYTPDEEHGVPVVRFRELSKHADELAAATTAVVIERLVERSLMLQLYTSGIFKRILLVPGCHDLISLKSTIRRVGGTLSIEVASDRPGKAAALGKRVFDLVLGGCALLVLSPVFLGLALAVRLDSPGPAFFTQPRWGGGSRTFPAFKFRTMHTDGDRRLKRHFLRNPAAEREYERYRKLDDDPRITRAGRVLRATSLDELPQLLNAVRGEMSIVGPRPYTLDELAKLGPAREILSAVRPGITGFWQVSGRNRRTFRERIEMDCYYVRNLSVWLDLWIIYRTAIAIVTREGK